MGEPGENVIEAAERALGPEVAKRLEWRRRMLLWLLPRINGGEEDKDQFIAMWEAALSEAHDEGIDYAAELVREVAKAKPDIVALPVIAEAIEKLAKRSRATAPQAGEQG